MIKRLVVLAGLLSACSVFFPAYGQSTMDDVNPACPDANILGSVINGVCWDCFLDDLSLFGVGSPPDGASSEMNLPVCSCLDALGVPELGYPRGFWSPKTLNEVVTTPWCSPSLGGKKLQDSYTGMGQNQSFVVGEAETPSAFYQYHYFAYPIMSMVGVLMLPDCVNDYVDFDLLYISEIDPLWNNDMLSLLLNPEAIIFSTPATYAWCAADCVMTTADNQLEEFYGCAACDGSLYPFTGNVFPQSDPVAGTSLITQRVLASLHRKGLARRTIGDEAMCKPQFHPTIPRSQYQFSMLYPVPEASVGPAKELSKPFIGDPADTGDQKANDVTNNAGTAGVEADVFEDCCHPMGMSTARWCTPVGGRTRPGKDTAYVYMIWNYRNCCVRTLGG